MYNWVLDFFGSHAHCTKYAGLVSAIATIHASVIRGSALGPASYIVTAADLHPVHACNRIFKFADDTYLVVPGVSADTCQAEIEHLHTWATANNLQLKPRQDEGNCLFRGSQLCAATVPQDQARD